MKIKPMLRRFAAWIASAARRFWQVLSRRFWMKLLSLALAILVWNYVVSSNNSITRTKTITGVNGYVTSQSTLTTYGLALLEDPTELIDNVSVRLEVAQSDYTAVSSENVQVTLDLSKVRTAGTQEVPLKASTSYGKVTDIYPETVTLTFEPLDSRVIPVNVSVGGEKSEDMWYNVVRTNPSSISVSGAASIVRRITQARVSTDVTGAEESYVRAEPYILMDSAGSEVSQTMLTRSSSSITVVTDVYPTKELPISTQIDEVITGRPAEGYAVSSVSIQPESITVAAQQELLDGISELLIEPVSVDGLSQSFTARAKISLLSDFENASAEQVYVNITISEKNVSEWIEDANISFVGKGENLQLAWQQTPVRVLVTGPRSSVEEMKRSGVSVTVDLTGLGAGSHSCELRFPEESYPGVSFEPETPAITVSLSELD